MPQSLNPVLSPLFHENLPNILTYILISLYYKYKCYNLSITSHIKHWVVLKIRTHAAAPFSGKKYLSSLHCLIKYQFHNFGGNKLQLLRFRQHLWVICKIYCNDNQNINLNIYFKCMKMGQIFPVTLQVIANGFFTEQFRHK